MLIRAQRPSHSIYWVVFLVPTLCVFYLLYPSPGQAAQLAATRDTHSDSAVPVRRPFPSLDVIQFWGELLDGLQKAEPTSPPITTYQPANRSDFDPKLQIPGGPAYQPPNLIDLTGEDRDSLRKSHNGFVSRIRGMSTRLPFERGSRGVVMTVGGSQVGMAVTSLLMLRQAGCSLPVQLFLDDATNHTRLVCEAVLEDMDVECLGFDAIFSATPAMPELSRFQFKVFSILFSSFQDILFLDADAFPIHDPDDLFDREPYSSHGLVTWPDFWLPTVSPAFHDIAGMVAPALSNSSRSSESGIMLYNKARHADSLLLAAYYNYHGPRYYYPLLSQGADGEGDKETFLQSARALGNPAYSVRTQIGVVGRWHDGLARSSALKQADPAHDWALVRARARSRRIYGWFSMRGRYGRDERIRARCMFIHHNQVKIDALRMDDALETVLRKDERGHYTRLWGRQRGLARTAGYDVERAMWKEVLRATCQASFAEECGRLREYFIEVFIERG